MIFSELYSAYYNAVAAILKAAAQQPVTASGMYEIIREKAFGDSNLMIGNAFNSGAWALLDAGRSILKKTPDMPLTLLQKSWINAIALDPRIKLFTDSPVYFEGVEPMFYPGDIVAFDRYSDGDDYSDENYIRHFRQVISAIHEHKALSAVITDRNGNRCRINLMPENLEYSEKDDKFRVTGMGRRGKTTLNLARIESLLTVNTPVIKYKNGEREPRTVVFELTDERNALERVLMHFAHFEKQAEKLENDKYRVTVRYDMSDETELVIRILQFGPMVKVISPDKFTELIKQRLIRQRNCGL